MWALRPVVESLFLLLFLLLLNVQVQAKEGSCSATSGECAASVVHASQRDFFSSYGTAYIQAEMLQDDIRTKAFRDAILGNRHLFEGKIVLDVGCGTGILSFFAAQAGAARVFAIEKSDMAQIAKRLAKDNGLADTVEIIQGLVEQVELPVSKVDIIVSEWIGTLLLHESMLDSVIFARNKWLKSDGFLVPDHAQLFLGGAEDQHSMDLDSWNDFYGLNYSALRDAWRAVGAQQCAIRRTLVTEQFELLNLDLYTVTVEDVDFHTALQLKVVTDRSIAAIISWFTLDFFSLERPGAQKLNSSQMTTHPDAECTHWQQTWFWLAKWVDAKVGTTMHGSFSARKAIQNPRDLAVDIALKGFFNESFVVTGADC